MPRRNKALVLAVTIWGLAAAFPRPGEAKSPGELNTAIAASLPGPEVKQFAIEANGSQAAIQTQELHFPLQSLPKDITLGSCAVRLVMAERYPKDQANESDLDPVVLSLFKSPLGPDPQPVAAWAVPPSTEKGAAIILRSRTLCAALTPGQAGPAAFLLQTTVRKGKVVLFGQSDDPSQAPRLLLTYTLPDAEPGEADWSQIRRDAQHSGRSRWHLYDPGGKYTPTQVAVVPLKTDGKPALSRDDLRQSPLLYGGRIFNALDAPGLNRYQLVARDRSGQVLSDVTVEGGKSPENENKKPIELPKFLVAGGRDRLYFFTENSIFGYSLASGSLLPAPEPPLATTNETLLSTSTPTLGADGSLYLATDKFGVRAYSPGPQQKLLWQYQYPNREGQVGAVALSKDETTAYILLGGKDTRLVALDSATGDCRWQQTVADSPITREVNETSPMPIPVVAGSVIEGNDILVTNATKGSPTGDKLYVFHDQPRAKTPAGGELVLPAPAWPSCRAEEAPGGMEVRGEKDHIPAPVAEPSDEAYYIRGGKLCRSFKGEDCTDRPLLCAGVDADGKAADAGDITHLVGDSSAHLYGLAAEKKLLFFITVGKWKTELKCNAYNPGGKLGANLILAPDGTLYNVNDEKLLQAIVPTELADATTKPTLELTDDLLGKNPDTAFRVSGKIQTAANLTLRADTNIILVAGDSISFGPGFTVKTGAQLRARVGLGN